MDFTFLSGDNGPYGFFDENFLRELKTEPSNNTPPQIIAGKYHTFFFQAHSSSRWNEMDYNLHYLI